MRDATTDFVPKAEELGGEGCGASGAEPNRVQFRGEKIQTVNLCESCLTAFEMAEFVNEVTRLSSEDRNSNE